MSHSEQFIDYSAHEYNVEGAGLLKQGREQEAIISFSKGLRFILRNLEQEFSNQINTIPLTLLRQHTGTMVNSTAEHSTRAIQSTPCLAANCDQDDVFILFNRTLILEETEPARPWSKNSYGSLMLGVIMYNLGLAMHLEGLKHGDSQKLLEAMHVYFMAYSSLLEFKRLLTDEDNAFDLALFALINNMAHIHAHFHRLTEAGQWVNELKILLSVALKPSTNIMIDEDLWTFLMNACLFQKDTLLAPAA